MKKQESMKKQEIDKMWENYWEKIRKPQIKKYMRDKKKRQND